MKVRQSRGADDSTRPPAKSRRSALRKGAVLLVVALAALAAARLFLGSRPDLTEQLTDAAELIERVGLEARIAAPRADEDLELVRVDGVELAASIYRPEGRPRGEILLAHGNTPLGRRLALYRGLGRGLAERGHFVVAFDFAGFGESGDPFEVGSLDAIDASRDLETALEWLQRSGPLQASAPVLVGHSGGAGVALALGEHDWQVLGVAALGPPRRGPEKLRSGADEYFWQRARRTRRSVYGDDFPSWYTKSIWLESALGSGAAPSLQVDLERYLPYLSGSRHPPVLLLDAELEPREDRDFLRRFYEQMSEPKEYRTLPGDHYADTVGVLGLIVYRPATLTATVDAITGWIESIGNASPVSERPGAVVTTEAQ